MMVRQEDEESEEEWALKWKRLKACAASLITIGGP